MKIIRRVSVRTRLLTALLCVSIVPAILIGIYASQVYSELFTGELSDFTEQAIRILDAELNAEFRRYKQVIDTVSISHEVQNGLTGRRGDIALKRAVDQIVLRRDFLRDLVLLDTDGAVIYSTGVASVPPSSLDLLIQLADEASSSDSFYYIGGTSGNLTIGRKIFKYPLGSEPVGYILAFINDALTNEIFSRVSIGTFGGEFFLLTDDGFVLASSSGLSGTQFMNHNLFAEVLAAESEGRESFASNVNGTYYLVVFSRSEENHTYLLAMIPQLAIQEGTRQVGRQLLILAAVTTAVCVALSILIYSSVAADFGDMTRMHIADQRRKRELELEALQYQINPHFLFNTLGTLKWAAVINKAPPIISEGLTSLSKLLQNVLLNKDEMITLREELSNLEHYFTIQKIRYADCFEVVHEVDEALLENPVPRLVLQPLAENAVLHGSEGGTRQIVITVRCQSLEGGILLEIKDNGSGFDPALLQRGSEMQLSGIGLSNVNERLKLYYGAESGLDIRSEVDVGTVCRIFIPEKQEA
jgi:two-component system sensor histidine kinase YesM